MEEALLKFFSGLVAQTIAEFAAEVQLPVAVVTPEELSHFVYKANMLFYLRPQAFLKALNGYRRQGRLKNLLRAMPAFAEYLGRVRGYGSPVVAGAVPGNLPGEKKYRSEVA